MVRHKMRASDSVSSRESRADAMPQPKLEAGTTGIGREQFHAFRVFISIKRERSR